MADKIFFGKVSEKVFNNGGSVIKIFVNEDDLKKLRAGMTIEVKKSQKGNWYAELSNYQPQPQRTYPQYDDYDAGDLNF